MIVDDFDSGIDGVRLGLLCEMLADAQREANATFLVTTHSMSAARRLADHAAVISDGAIVQAGRRRGARLRRAAGAPAGDRRDRGPITLRDV